MRAIIEIPAKSQIGRVNALSLLLRGLVALNRWLLARHDLPPLYESGVRYRRDAAGTEIWSAATIVYQRRRGDCEDLSCWRAAELQNAGVDAIACVKRTGRRRLHAIVCYPDGTIEDPSRILGMR